MEEYSSYINGKWTGDSGPVKVVNPATGEDFAEVKTLSREGVKRALEYAQESFHGWKSLTGIERGDCLHGIVRELEKRRDRVARLLTMENGKPLAQSQAEVDMTVDHFRWFAEEARRGYGRTIPHQAHGKRHFVIKQPVGVVGAISPWNFPLALGARKVAPAMAAGCPVVLKPAEATPLSSLELARCADEAGVPPGVFQVVVGNAPEIGAEMLENPLCRKISFTGSTAVGKLLIRGAAETCTLLSMELGGNAPAIVFDDADFELALEGAIITKFRNGGQSCIASNRIYVHRQVYDAFLEAFTERARKLKVGNGLDEGVDLGAIVDEKGIESALAFIDDAVKKGARVLCGGKRMEGKGNFLEATVMADVTDAALCSREEIFAPVAAVYPFDSEEEVIKRANDTEYGLAAYVFTRDLSRAMRVAEGLEAGTVGVNDPVPTVSTSPFGGVKQSGWGRELGIEGMDAFMETKHVSLGNID